MQEVLLVGGLFLVVVFVLVLVFFMARRQGHDGATLEQKEREIAHDKKIIDLQQDLQRVARERPSGRLASLERLSALRKRKNT